MLFQISLAGQVVEINSLYEKVYTYCEGYVVSNQSPPSIVVTISQRDIEREDAACLYEEWRRKATVYMMYSPKHLEILAVYRKIVTDMLKYDTFLMHGSVISTDNQGYMITAHSGVGKTTRTRLWISNIPNSFVVNGDKPLLKVTSNGVYAFGTPWSGKEGWNTNTSVPLRAIFLLERTDEPDENSVTEISFSEAFYTLWQQSFRADNIEGQRKTLQLLKCMGNKVKFYRFRSNPTIEAVKMAYDTARSK